MVIWVCEASEVNNLTVLAVGPNGRDKNKNKNKIASSRSDPPKGSDKYRNQVVRNTVRSFGEIHLSMFEKYSNRRGEPYFL